MKKKSIPPFMLTEGQRGRILFEFKLGDGAEVPELCGALMVHGQRVDMEAEDEGTLVIPVLPAGVYLAEVRAGGVCVLYGHVEVLPSPLRLAEGDAVFQMTVDCTTDVLRVRLELAAGIPGRRGAPGPQGEKGAQGAPGLSAYELACLHGFAGSEAEWVAEFEGAQAAASEARDRAEDAAAAARAAEDAREAAAADKAAAEQAKNDALAAQSKAEQEAARSESAQAKAEQEAAEVAEVSWARGFPVFEWEMDAPDEVQLDQLAAFWHMKNVAVLCKGKCADGLPELVWAAVYRSMGAAAWVNIVFKAEERFRAIYNFEQHAPSVENCFYAARGNGNNGCFNFANGLYYKTDIRNTNWGGFSGGKCKAFEHSSEFPMDTVYFEMNVAGNVSRSYANLGTTVNRICQSKDGALQYVKVPAGTWEKAEVAQYAFSGAYALPERYIPDALPSLRDGTGMFSGCRLSAGKAVSILSSLQPVPAGSTYKMTMGFHIDHQADEEVLAAIDAATAKGWTVERQWNGTATASTFALRPAPPLPVYAKLNAYTDAEGNEWPILDWCHQVSSPSGKTPEELGYTQFESVAAAREYFGLPAAD